MTSIEEALRSGAWRLVPVEAIAPFVKVAEELPDHRVLSEAHPEWERCMRRFSIALGALTVRNFRNLTASPDHTPALVALIEERDRLKVERDDLVSRAEVLRVLRRLGDQDADLALYGAEDNARAREYGEAAMTRARCAVAIMPSSAGMSEAELREAVRGSVGLGLDAEDAADEVIRRIFGERS